MNTQRRPGNKTETPENKMQKQNTESGAPGMESEPQSRADSMESGAAGTGGRLPNKVSLGLRIVVGVYLIYTAYSLLESFRTHTGRELVFFAFFALLFAAAGVVLTAASGYAFWKGKYEGGAMDSRTQESEESAEK